jgi:hypothetical protein
MMFMFLNSIASKLVISNLRLVVYSCMRTGNWVGPVLANYNPPYTSSKNRILYSMIAMYRGHPP